MIGDELFFDCWKIGWKYGTVKVQIEYDYQKLRRETMGKTSNRIGDKTVLTNTLECEIIGVCKDKRYVRIQFEDGEILERVNIAQFTAKQIRHPHIESVNMVGKRKKCVVVSCVR